MINSDDGAFRPTTRESIPVTFSDSVSRSSRRTSLPPGSMVDKKNAFAARIFTLITDNDVTHLALYMEELGG